jgi:hypothetical protein
MRLRGLSAIDGFAALVFSEDGLRGLVLVPLLGSLITAHETLDDSGLGVGSCFDLFAGALWHGEESWWPSI